MKIRIPTELENSVIGCILLQPDALVTLDWLESEHFASSAAREAWGAIRSLEASASPIDFVTVLDRLQRSGSGASEKSEEFLGGCIRGVSDVGSIQTYAEQVRDEGIERRIRIELERVANASASSGSELLSMALEAITKLDLGLPEQTPTIHQAVKRRMKQLEQIAAARAAGVCNLTGFPTGIAKLDELTGGWQPKIVSIVCARPAMGKSSLGLASADACTAAGFGVHLFSLEDTEESYADRTISRESRVPAESMRNATNLSRSQLSDMAMAIGRVRDRHWLIDSRSGISAEEIVRSIRKHRKENDTRVVIVDYVQLIKPTRGASRHDQLTEIVTTLADAAKHDDVAIVLMSQLNREVEKRTDKRPMMSDLRESGSLEERAKCVVGIYRGSYYSENPVEGVDYPSKGARPSNYDFAKQVQLLVLKNNNGATGSVVAEFHGPTTRME